MLKQDKDKLKELMMNYSAKEILEALSRTADDVAGELSDLHEGSSSQISKEYSQLATTFEDLAKGRPFLM